MISPRIGTLRYERVISDSDIGPEDADLGHCETNALPRTFGPGRRKIARTPVPVGEAKLTDNIRLQSASQGNDALVRTVDNDTPVRRKAPTARPGDKTVVAVV